MSLFKKVFKSVGKVASKTFGAVAKVAPYAGIVPGLGIAGKVLGSVGAIGARSGALGMLPSLGRALPAIGAIGGAIGRSPTLRKWSVRAAKAAGYIVSGIYVYDVAGNLVGQVSRSRRINPLNAKALTRAMKRVCKARDIAKKVENISKCAPKRRRSC